MARLSRDSLISSMRKPEYIALWSEAAVSPDFAWLPSALRWFLADFPKSADEFANRVVFRYQTKS